MRFTSSVEPESFWKLPTGVTQLQSRVDKDESVRGRPIMPFAIFGSCPYPGWIENFQIYEPRYRLRVSGWVVGGWEGEEKGGLLGSHFLLLSTIWVVDRKRRRREAWLGSHFVLLSSIRVADRRRR